MTPADSFVAAIAAEPDEDAHRLVYADWLGENDDPDRAEFIRIQVRRARGGLTRRERQLLKAHAAEWLGPLAGLEDEGFNPTFRRGFVEAAAASGRVLVEHD